MTICAPLQRRGFMSEKASKTLFIVEYIIIMLPLAMVLLLATLAQLFSVFSYHSWIDLVILFCALLACVALTSGYIVSNNFILHGTMGLRTVKPRWWKLSFIGVALTIAAGISKLLPVAPEYSSATMFRHNFELFIFGSPFFMPLTHLLIEKYLRKR